MRQESIELHRIMIEVRARAEQQLEQQKTLERLVTANTLMQKANVSSQSKLLLYNSNWPLVFNSCTHIF